METTGREFGLLVRRIQEARPEVAAVTDAVSFRPAYRFFPARVTLRGKNGELQTEVLKTSSERKSLEFEREVLKALQELGLPVPLVKSPLFEFVDNGAPCWGLLLQELEGRPLEWLGLDDLHAAHRTCERTIEAVERLHSLTERVLRHPIASILPRKSLVEEFDLIKRNAGAWSGEAFFQAASAALEDLLPQITVPLTFSNGDYNPLNFLANGQDVVGWIDFEHACFEDPHIGFAKFLLWSDDAFGWATGTRAGLVERYLFKNNVRPCDFYGRVVLRGLYHIHLRSVGEPPSFMIGVVTSYTDRLKSVTQTRAVGRWNGGTPGESSPSTV